MAIVRATSGAMLALCAVAWCQDDSIRLRNGEVLVGQVGDCSNRGCTLRKWDGSGTIPLRWDQLAEADRDTWMPREARNDPPMIQGIRIVTDFRTLEGIVVRETDISVEVRVPGSDVARIAPKSAIRRRTLIVIREDDIFSPGEIVDRRIGSVDERDPAALARLGDMARGMELFDKAELLYRKARDRYAEMEQGDKAEACEQSMQDAGGIHSVRDHAKRLRVVHDRIGRLKLLKEVAQIEHPQATALLLTELGEPTTKLGVLQLIRQRGMIDAAVRAALQREARSEDALVRASAQSILDEADGATTRKESASTQEPAFFGIPVTSQRIVIIMDRSGSMAKQVGSKRRRIDWVRQEIDRLLSLMPTGSKVNIVLANDAVETLFKVPVTLDAPTRQGIATALKECEPVGRTDVRGALRKAMGLCGEGLLEPFDTVIAVFDGVSESKPEEFLKDVRAWNPRGRAVVHTVLLGNEGRELLQQLARENGGSFACPE